MTEKKTSEQVESRTEGEALTCAILKITTEKFNQVGLFDNSELSPKQRFETASEKPECAKLCINKDVPGV